MGRVIRSAKALGQNIRPQRRLVRAFPIQGMSATNVLVFFSLFRPPNAGKYWYS